MGKNASYASVLRKYIPVKNMYMHLVNGMPSFFNGKHLVPMKGGDPTTAYHGNFLRTSIREIRTDQMCHAMWAFANRKYWAKLKRKFGIEVIPDKALPVYISYIRMSLPLWEESIIEEPKLHANWQYLKSSTTMQRFIARSDISKIKMLNELSDLQIDDFFKHIQQITAMRFYGTKTKRRGKSDAAVKSSAAKRRKAAAKLKPVRGLSKLGRAGRLFKYRRKPKPSQDVPLL